MASQPGQQTIAIHMSYCPRLISHSQSKGNQTIKFGQLTEYSKKAGKCSLKNHAENVGERLPSSRPLFVL